MKTLNQCEGSQRNCKIVNQATLKRYNYLPFEVVKRITYLVGLECTFAFQKDSFENC